MWSVTVPGQAPIRFSYLKNTRRNSTTTMNITTNLLHFESNYIESTIMLTQLPGIQLGQIIVECQGSSKYDVHRNFTYVNFNKSGMYK